MWCIRNSSYYICEFVLIAEDKCSVCFMRKSFSDIRQTLNVVYPILYRFGNIFSLVFFNSNDCTWCRLPLIVIFTPVPSKILMASSKYLLLYSELAFTCFCIITNVWTMTYNTIPPLS